MANDSSGLPWHRNNKKCLLKICLNIDANLQAQQQFPSSPGDTGKRERGKKRGKAFGNWLGKRISQSTRPASPRTLKSSQKLNFKPIVASPEPAPAAAPASDPAVGLWPHLGMCIESSPVELRHLHHMPNREQERAKAALWLKCSECCSFLWHGQLAEGFGAGEGVIRRV